MRSRLLVLVLVLTAAVYLLWRWSVAGSHDVTAIVSGVALVPLFIVLVALTVRHGATALARVALRRRSRIGGPHAARLRRRSRSAATTMVSGGHDEPSPGGVSSSASSSKIAA